jgi:ketosteroid isomerase-like protein
MSQENVESFKRASDAFARRDVDALLAESDPNVEIHPAIPAGLGGEATVYHGHDGVRAWLRDQEEVFVDVSSEYTEIRDLGEQVLAIGRLRARGKQSGADIESPIGWVVEFKNGRGIHVRGYLNPEEALEAAGLEE